MCFMKRVAIYCSVNNEKHGINKQKQESVKYCNSIKRRYDVYIDKDVNCDILDRLQLHRLISNIKFYDTVVCTDLAVISRDIKDMKRLMKELKSNNVDLVILHKIIKNN